jgi:hypothetical protein
MTAIMPRLPTFQRLTATGNTTDTMVLEVPEVRWFRPTVMVRRRREMPAERRDEGCAGRTALTTLKIAVSGADAEPNPHRIAA